MKLQTKLLQIAALCLALVTASMFSYAESNPKYVPFQGRIHDDTGALNGIYTLKLSMYNTETGGKAIWTEEHKDVSVTYGYVNLLLGATSPFEITKDTVTTDIDFSKPNFIGIQISKVSESGTTSQFSNELLPRHRMVPSFHAIGADHAKTADVAKNALKLDGEGSGYYAKGSEVINLQNSIYYTEIIDGKREYVNEDNEIALSPVEKFLTKTEISLQGSAKIPLTLWEKATFDLSLSYGVSEEIITNYLREKGELNQNESYVFKPGIYFITAKTSNLNLPNTVHTRRLVLIVDDISSPSTYGSSTIVQVSGNKPPVIMTPFTTIIDGKRGVYANAFYMANSQGGSSPYETLMTISLGYNIYKVNYVSF